MPRRPVEEYFGRRESWSRTHRERLKEDAHLAQARLLTFAGAVVLAVLAYRGFLSAWWLLAPLAVFIVLLKRHDRVIRARDEAARLVAFYDRGIARLEDRWIGTGEPGDRFLDEDHLYAADLDLFGRGSLFELLSLARTRAGEETLASWLKQPAPSAGIRGRHESVRELCDALEIREQLALAGYDVRTSVHPEALVAWGAQPLPALGLRRITALIVTAACLSLAIAWALSGALWPLLLAIAVAFVYNQREGERIETILQRADGASRDLDVLSAALRVLEQNPFNAPALVALQRRLSTARLQSSDAIARLHRYIEMHDWAHNVFFTPFALLLMWNAHLAWAVEQWRGSHGAHVAAWLETVGEFEALSSLAAYTYEHPDDPFPEILDAAPGGRGAGAPPAIFDGGGLGHPLLPSAQMVRNDVRLDAGTQLLVVSGSNMSGKSTLVRTVGINAVLALAGAPVRATFLRISPLAIGATLRIQDSLQQGRSRFYAEITRIRRLSDVAAAQPLLFLLDELFHGTNSHDRLIGASGVLRHLVDRGAIGLITTHDLALTAVTNELGDRAVNVHFEDRFEGQEMRFDYRMKPGPVTRSNAIALMRAVGLEVDERSES